ncbi:MAG: TIGR01777 family oxidoreductase [Gammaproteobacteria bacterium]
MQRLLVTGGTGFIGTALCRYLLDQGYRLTVLTRDTGQAGLLDHMAIRYVSDLREITADDTIDSIVNLAGQSLNSGRWNAQRKQQFIDSRVDTTNTVIQWAARQKEIPRVLISGSAIGWYGHRDATALTESDPPGDGFAHELCERWERAADAATALGMRIVFLRIGLVLERDGGPLPELLPAFRLGAGGPMGSGRQYWSWIHRNDLVRLIEFALNYPGLNGPVNATAPEPVPQREFARTLGRTLRRPSFVPLPAFVARLLLGEFAEELLLNGQNVVPEKAVYHGFEFDFPQLDGALADILHGSRAD